jgi:microcystin-dependent protein
LSAGSNFDTGAIDTTSINDDAVTGPKIAANAVTLAKLATDVANALNPTGVIQAYVGAVAPAGWLLCDGTAFSSTTYPALYALLGNTAFVPDLRDRFIVGASATKTIRTTGGSATIGLNNLPAHSHPNTASWSGSASVSISDPGHGHSASAGNTNLDHRHSAQAKQGTSSMAHNGTTTYAAGGSPNTGEVYPNTSFAESIVHGSMDHAHSITVSGNTTGITATSSVSGTVTLTNANNVTTASDYWQPYYAVSYIIKAA